MEKAGKVSGVMWLLAVPKGLGMDGCWVMKEPSSASPSVLVLSSLGQDPAVENASLV